MPIKNIIFHKHMKFDGENDRALKPFEVKQICGRAGVMGFEDIGYIGAFDSLVLKFVKGMLKTNIKDIKPPFNVSANFSQVKLISNFLKTDNIYYILDFFASWNLSFIKTLFRAK